MKRLHKFNITAAVLKKTDMGLFVNKLKTHEDNEVSRLSKDIIRTWKAQVTKESATSSSTTTTTTKSETKGSTTTTTTKTSSSSLSSSTTSRPAAIDTKASSAFSSQGASPSASGGSSPKTPTSAAAKDRTVRSDGIRIRSTGNDTRDRCIEMLYQALGTESNAAVFKKMAPEGSPNQNYRHRIRTFFMNLRNKSNPKLREAVVDGEVSVDDFCEYTIQDMASAEAKARDRAIELENMFLAKGAEEQQAETDMFRCGKCKGRKTRYYQMQTRSADEPMTTFVTCINCGNRWKFS
ncbi:RNA polymerase II elongation factor [Lunasporangiospora selenospora]|uniref:RNA polymerase II elongation factor n=1 Tax=Lunasporangiospora selenospora TaxID=979761 RepID=A0A9P6KCU7_9FUNG|nr:RNA polymerase II elongation factor [Lunasporangiospora selenospora]